MISRDQINAKSTSSSRDKEQSLGGPRLCEDVDLLFSVCQVSLTIESAVVDLSHCAIVFKYIEH